MQQGAHEASLLAGHWSQPFLCIVPGAGWRCHGNSRRAGGWTCRMWDNMGKEKEGILDLEPESVDTLLNLVS
ncbi:hypothetical protein SKAU_G00414460 [Synaphobranchus kaupii]|uniref:Uncharacterized protein n=1 Tax=Synaphobranchus kaupii TaxID=118154 RepID=A0A9Q1E714_SYNKA|nr:hypothetical protein SKAU_G00414460 [Synaphobranchus kaupii]